MATDNYLENKINEVGCLYKYDLLKDFLQDEYRKDDYLYNFYSSCVKEIESTNLPNCIYELLWGWTKQNKNKCCDIMNSFNTYMNKMVESMINNKYYDDGSMNEAFKKFKEILDAPQAQIGQQLVFYLISNHEIKEKMNEKLDEMIQLSKWTNTIGNFILLPQTKRGDKGENVYKNSTGYDRMDVYLNYLKNDFYKNNIEAFKNYINENYLWDYVDKNYNVIPLFPKSDNTKIEIEKELPDDPRCYIVFTKNVINNIKRRGMFIEIMIRLSIELQEKFEDVKETKNASSYSKVIEKIETLNPSEDLINFIEEFQMGIV